MNLNHDEVLEGVESIIVRVAISKTIEKINYIDYNQQRMFNFKPKSYIAIHDQLYV